MTTIREMLNIRRIFFYLRVEFIAGGEPKSRTIQGEEKL